MAENIEEVLWLVTADRDVLYVSPCCDDVWGNPRPDHAGGAETWLDSIHPEDRVWVGNAVKNGDMEEKFQAEYRIRRPNGEEPWIRNR